MSEEPDNLDPKTEELLRRWGAVEAARESAPGEFAGAARLAAGEPAKSRWPWRWMPAAAAAVLLAGAGWLYVKGPGLRQTPVAGTTQRPAAETGPARESAELAAARAELARKDQELAAARGEAGRLAGEVQRLSEQAASAVRQGQEAARAAEEAAKTAQAAGERARGELAAAEGQRVRLAQELAAAKASRDEAAAKAARMNVLTEEIDRLRQMNTEAAMAQQKARTELQTARMMQGAVLAAARKAYVQALAGERMGRVEAMQAAARKRRMLERAGEVGAQVRSAKGQEAVALLEEAFTRLDLIDPADLSEGKRFERLVAEKKLVERIDEALGFMDVEPVRLWLVEASLILAGGDHV